MMLAYLGFGLIKGLILLYTLLSYPFYLLLVKRRNDLEQDSARARVVQRSDNEVTYRCSSWSCPPRDEILAHPDQIDTLSKLFNFIVKKYGSRSALGTRNILGEEAEKQPDGKVFNKLILGDYEWMSYKDVALYADNFGKGIRELDIQPLDKVCIFADSRAEWLMTAIGCFKNRIALCTIYTNLGEDGIVHGITQTQVSTVITSVELLPKLVKVRDQIPNVKNIIFMESSTKPSPEPVEGLNYLPWSKVVDLGKKSSLAPAQALPDDTAIIMFTSGSTGVPKGVILTHKNMVSGILSIVSIAVKAMARAGPISSEDSYIAYLPLAHVLEMLAEHVMLLLGVKIGYSNPNTLTDKGTMIKSGEKGDASILCPTIMAGVPLILDRIYKGIQNNINEQGKFKQLLVNYCFQYRIEWAKKGFNTPIMDKLIFSKMKAIIGGKLKVLLSGGAPLAGDAHSFIRNALCCDLLQGYGLTETCSTATISDPSDLSTGNVGPPLMGVDLKVCNWDEGGYTVNDTIGPRGEILIGGDHVSPGYYNMPSKTAEDFFHSEGKQFFRTGDIGQILPDGSVKIIDRKKDLVKLQAGEYVSLAKVESNLKINPLIENICVFGDSKNTFTVALVVPDEIKLIKLGEVMNRVGKSREDLCQDPRIVKGVLETLTKQAHSTKLEKFEIPKKIRLLSEPWTPESGLVTAAFKLRRKPIQNRFQDLIDEMYAEENGSSVVGMNGKRKSQDKNNNNPKIIPV